MTTTLRMHRGKAFQESNRLSKSHALQGPDPGPQGPLSRLSDLTRVSAANNDGT